MLMREVLGAVMTRVLERHFSAGCVHCFLYDHKNDTFPTVFLVIFKYIANANKNRS
jgi:hypothetical protein